MTLVAGLFGDDVDVLVDIDPGSGSILVDRQELTSAFLNIVLNARWAMPEGGTLIVTSARRRIVAGAADAGVAPGDYVEIAIADTGFGMAEAIRRRAFEPFFTTKRSAPQRARAYPVHGFAASRARATIESLRRQGTNGRLLRPAFPERRPPETSRRRAGVDGAGGGDVLFFFVMPALFAGHPRLSFGVVKRDLPPLRAGRAMCQQSGHDIGRFFFVNPAKAGTASPAYPARSHHPDPGTRRLRGDGKGPAVTARRAAVTVAGAAALPISTPRLDAITPHTAKSSARAHAARSMRRGRRLGTSA